MNKQIILISAVCTGGYNDTLVYNAGINYFGEYKEITLLKDYNGLNLKTDLYLTKEAQEKILNEISNNLPSFRFDNEPKIYNRTIPMEIDWDNKEQVLEVVKHNGTSLKVASSNLKADKEVVLEAVKNHCMALQFASKELQEDKDVVLAAVNQNGWVLEYVLPELRADKDIILAAIDTNGWTLEYASTELQNDKEVVLKAVKQNGYALDYASSELQADKDVVLEAVKTDGGALQFASKELQNDKDIVMAAVTRNERSLRYASENLKNDRDVVLVAIKEDGYVLDLASKELQEDKELQRIARNNINGIDLEEPSSLQFTANSLFNSDLLTSYDEEGQTYFLSYLLKNEKWYIENSSIVFPEINLDKVQEYINNYDYDSRKEYLQIQKRAIEDTLIIGAEAKLQSINRTLQSLENNKTVENTKEEEAEEEL